MNKNFDDWMLLKKSIHNESRRPIGYKEREIWWVYLGENIGTEEDGKGNNFTRPVLILRGFNKKLFWAIPLSTTKNRGPYYYEFMMNGKLSVALVSQIRTLDTVRLISKYGHMNMQDFLIIKTKIKILLDNKR